MSYFSDAFIEAVRLLLSLDKELYGIIFLSIKITTLAILISTAIGMPLGIVIGLRKFIGKAVIMNIINTLMGIPPVVVGLTVYILLSNQMGILGSYRLLFTPAAMVTAQVLLAVPLITGLTVVAVQGVDPLIRKAAISLGATRLQFSWTVVKEARYGLGSAVIVAFGRLMAEVGAVMMVGGNVRFQTRVMTTAIALHKGMGEFQEALALGMILLMISFTINAGLELLRSSGRVAQ